MKALKVLLGALLTVSITINIYQYNQLQNMQSIYKNQNTETLELSEQIKDYKSLLEDEEKAIAELESTIAELKETQDIFMQENQELEKQLEELTEAKHNEENVSGAYLVEKMPEKPASQPSSGGSLSKDDIMSKLGGLGANGGMGGMTNGGQASADSGYTGNVQLQ